MKALTIARATSAASWVVGGTRRRLADRPIAGKSGTAKKPQGVSSRRTPSSRRPHAEGAPRPRRWAKTSTARSSSTRSSERRSRATIAASNAGREPKRGRGAAAATTRMVRGPRRLGLARPTDDPSRGRGPRRRRRRDQAAEIAARVSGRPADCLVPRKGRKRRRPDARPPVLRRALPACLKTLENAATSPRRPASRPQRGRSATENHTSTGPHLRDVAAARAADARAGQRLPPAAERVQRARADAVGHHRHARRRRV